MFSQIVTIDNNVPLPQLIENNLIEGCGTISNVTSFINGSIDGLSSYGAFDRADSNFPLSNGIVLATGDAASGGNTPTLDSAPDLSEGTTSWGTDPDIETYLGITGSVNATSIEFDFVAISDVIQFNYLLASEEYFGSYPCGASDGFVFLIRETSSTGPYQNIATVPVSGDVVTINNIHNEITSPTTGSVLCPATNDAYFDGFWDDTNYNGRTSVFSATTSLTPNTQYHIKLIIADQNNNAALDTSIDSAVFIEANAIYELDLGEDNIKSCIGDVILNGQITNPLANYTWYRDGIVILGENTSTLTARSTGVYSLEIEIEGFEDCPFQDEVTVTIEPELPTNPIADYELCDVGNDNIEVFDLTTRDNDVINAIDDLPEFYTISYYISEDDARNDITNNITSIPTGPTTIYVRVEDTTFGCLFFGSIDLVLIDLPVISLPMFLDICDNDSTPDASTTVDLTQKDDEITGGDPDLSVSYHFTESGAQNNTDIATSPHTTNTNTSNTIETLYIRVENTATGCVSENTQTLTIDVTNGVTGIVRERQYLDGCDHTNPFMPFDLTEASDIIMNGLIDIVPTFYTTQEDAENDTNPITNPDNYTNELENEQIIFLRLLDINTGCFTVVEFEIHTSVLRTETNIPERGFDFCDFSNDGIEEINLEEDVSAAIRGQLSETMTVIVTYYETEIDRDDRTNPITINDYSLDSFETTLYITMETAECTDLSEIVLRLNTTLGFAPVTIPYCDTDDDGVALVDFSTFDSLITGSSSGYIVSYFTSFDDADSNSDEIVDLYPTSSNTFYARILSAFTGCHSVAEFYVDVSPAPTVSNPIINPVCNLIGSTTTLRLQDLIDDDEIVTALTNPNIEFFTNLTDAENFDSSDPANNIDKESFTTPTQTIYIRVESETPPFCVNIIPLEIIVSTKPIIPIISPLSVCDDTDSPLSVFNLLDKDEEILNGEIGREVKYFSDSGLTNEIDRTIDASAYSAADGTTIYVLVENINNRNCVSAPSSFQLQVNNYPNYNTGVTNFGSDCLNPESGTRDFDLAAKREEMREGITEELFITFYLNEDDARANNDNILPDIYSSEDSGQFWARIENAERTCADFKRIDFSIFPSPIINSATIPSVCDTDYDGIASINISGNINNDTFQIGNIRPGFGEVTLTFYKDEALTIQIPDSQLSNYTVDNFETIYVRVEHNDSGCDDSAPVDLQVIIPPSLYDIETIAVCDYTSGNYDLSNVDFYIVDSSSDVTISYHNTQANAENNTGIYTSKIFNYTSFDTFTIYVRVQDNLTGCARIEPILLQINQNPTANTPTNLTICDTDFDNTNTMPFDLTINDSNILGSQNPADYSVYYYDILSNAEVDYEKLNDIYNAFNEEIIYARIENNVTKCYDITEFKTIINPLPIIPINEIEPICGNDYPRTLSALTGNHGETYLWSTGEITPEIVVDTTDVGPHFVIVTTALGCRSTKEFNLVRSETANIEATFTVNFSDPNSIIVNVIGSGEYEFILDEGEPDEIGPQTSNTFSNVSVGEHIITIIDLNGCEPINRPVFVFDIPKFLTPNNDGYFDTWHIIDASLLPGTNVYIYNRHGKLLKTLAYNSPGWDGKYEGVIMPADDYWFVADILINGGRIEVKGHFTLRR